ncbi:TetR/AcrR family transcriptional regulator [Nocardia sp. alder85J]|uniref:TetR/AcrR family transcriptional regulator n=1 Tax=Nocardia sp. alder85J TaxID=2862949 RepID=UPI001CD33B35|nr:TetR/AcrR family transcriptional regulator [Nocardia sp. alder85J]MCX4095512.1 TetR family transcriptional regulator [Nocardia sp. alder85J]
MARIAETRPPAAPVSRQQVQRRERILDAAATLGAEADYERVQMLDVAKRAGVAIGTLYRYFPSKTHLFSAVFERHITGFVATGWSAPTGDPIADVGENLVALGRELLRTPRLCGAMMQATAAEYLGGDEGVTPRLALVRAILATLGRSAAETDLGAVRLLTYSWWGVLVSWLSQKIAPAAAEADMRLAAQLILLEYTR